jgi:hypothetical protein
VNNDDELDIELRSPAEVATRAIILASLIRRLSIESLAAEAQVEALAGEAFDLRAWLQSEGLWDHLGDTEAAFLEQPLGGLSDAQMATVAWQAEGLATLGWALGLAELAPVGDLKLAETVLTLVPSPWDKTAPWIHAAVLQPEPDIARERDRAELIEWRISIEAPLRTATDEERSEYHEAIADVAREADVAGLVETSAGDFTLAGLPPSSMSDDDLERLAALAEERLRALNWLCGFGDSWDTVPLDI